MWGRGADGVRLCAGAGPEQPQIRPIREDTVAGAPGDLFDQAKLPQSGDCGICGGIADTQPAANVLAAPDWRLLAVWLVQRQS